MFPLIFGIGGLEILVILLVFLLFFGAKSIPGLARNLGRMSRQIKDASQELQRELKDTTDDIKKEVENHKKNFKDLADE